MKKILLNSRREFLQSAAIILVAGSLDLVNTKALKNESEFKTLDENYQIDIGNKGKEIIKNAYELGCKYEGKYKGCARCTVAALQDAIGFIPDNRALFRSASCLDSGATPTKNANCGTFTAAGIVIGWICGNDNFCNNELSHNLIRKVYKYFEVEYRSVICKKIRLKVNKKCPEVVGKAAKWTAEVLLKQFTNYD